MAKKNYRTIPPNILARITSLAVDDVVVACVKRITPQDVVRYAHLNLRIEDGVIVVPPPAVPPAEMGKYSDANVNGREVVRRDLPKIQKTTWFEAPNWGDWYNGSHTVELTREVYQRDLIPPKEVTLSVEVLEQSPDGEGFIVKFSVDQVLNRGTQDFEDDLLYNLNILQENVGAVSLFASAATLAEYVATIHVDWEILPPGTVDDVLRTMLRGKRPVAVETQEVMRARLAELAQLNPQSYIAGTSEFLRYFGARFADDFVVFENLSYGNALYVMYENWATLSQRSRVDLLKGPRNGFERILHTDGWGNRLKSCLREYWKRKERTNRP